MPEFAPHATTVPSSRKARLCKAPAATATTFVKPAGTVVWPPLYPHATTVPSARKARLLTAPPAMATAFVKPAGTSVWPPQLAPQAATTVIQPRVDLSTRIASELVTAP